MLHYNQNQKSDYFYLLYILTIDKTETHIRCLLIWWTNLSFWKLGVNQLSIKLPPANNFSSTTGHNKGVRLIFINFHYHYTILWCNLKHMSVEHLIVLTITSSFSAFWFKVMILPCGFTSKVVTTSLWSQSSTTSGFGSPT